MSDHASNFSSVPIGPKPFEGPVRPDDYAKKGLCDIDKTLPQSQCFLGDERARHITLFSEHVDSIGKRMNHAILQLRMESLTRGEKSLGLVAGFVIDLAFGPLGKYAGKALASVAGDVGAQAAESIGKSAVDLGKKVTQNHLKSEASEAPKAEATKTTSMLDILTNQVDLATSSIQAYGANNADDHQLLRYIETYKPRPAHEYKRQIEEYLQRLEKSDVWNLGRNEATTDRFRIGGNMVTRDIRCVWVVNSVLGTRTLYFEKHDGQITGDAPVLDHLRPDRAGFGNMRNADDQSNLGSPVPAEFVGLALERHIQMWGGAPPEYQINTMGQMSKDSKPSADHTAKQAGASTTKAAGNGLPPGSASELHAMYFGAEDHPSQQLTQPTVETA